MEQHEANIQVPGRLKPEAATCMRNRLSSSSTWLAPLMAEMLLRKVKSSATCAFVAYLIRSNSGCCHMSAESLHSRQRLNIAPCKDDQSLDTTLKREIIFRGQCQVYMSAFFCICAATRSRNPRIYRAGERTVDRSHKNPDRICETSQASSAAQIIHAKIKSTSCRSSEEDRPRF